MDDPGDIKDAAVKMVGEFRKENAVDLRNKSYKEWEKGKMSQLVREAFEEDVLRYKHLLELADKNVPDWVKDVSN